MPESRNNLRSLCTIKQGVIAISVVGIAVVILQFRSFYWVIFLYVPMVLFIFVVTHYQLVEELVTSCFSCFDNDSDTNGSNDGRTREVTSTGDPNGAANQEDTVNDVPPPYDDFISSEPLPPSYAEALAKTDNSENTANNVNSSTTDLNDVTCDLSHSTDNLHNTADNLHNTAYNLNNSAGDLDNRAGNLNDSTDNLGTSTDNLTSTTD